MVLRYHRGRLIFSARWEQLRKHNIATADIDDKRIEQQTETMYSRSLLAGVVFALCGACTTQPISNAGVAPVSSGRVLDPTFTQPAPGTTAVTIKRDVEFFGAGCSCRVFLNAKPIADLFASEQIVFYLPAGEYRIAVWPNNSNGTSCGGAVAEVQATVKLGVEQSFRIGFASNGAFRIFPTGF
jgi:hypothetical protein